MYRLVLILADDRQPRPSLHVDAGSDVFTALAEVWAGRPTCGRVEVMLGDVVLFSVERQELSRSA